ncbi:MAG: hypothetical protein IPF82_11845 [Blastocatellia bacterium]|nr:hypothetical protein [Blastocatellia bacterium]
MHRRILALAVIILVAVASAACATSPPTEPIAPGSDWHEFEGTWTASGTRHTILLGDGRSSAVIELEGTMLLAGPGRPGVGFRSRVIGLVDSASGFEGRSVWTDENGDQAFSELKGTGTEAQNRLEGTFVGGTGRYAGATGSYEFSWQYMIESEDGRISGRAIALKGRVRTGVPPAGSAP